MNRLFLQRCTSCRWPGHNRRTCEAALPPVIVEAVPLTPAELEDLAGLILEEMGAAVKGHA